MPLTPLQCSHNCRLFPVSPGTAGIQSVFSVSPRTTSIQSVFSVSPWTVGIQSVFSVSLTESKLHRGGESSFALSGPAPVCGTPLGSVNLQKQRHLDGSCKKYLILSEIVSEELKENYNCMSVKSACFLRSSEISLLRWGLLNV